MDPPAGEHQLRVCTAAGCLSSHSDELKTALEAELKAHGRHDCKVKGVGCLGLCSAGPLVQVAPEGTMLQNVTPADAAAVVEGLDKGMPEELTLPADLPFFTGQKKVVLENCGRIDPENIQEYISVGGYVGLLRTLNTRLPAGVIEEVVKSGLRGRGGAGYPAGLKWSTVAKAPGEKRYVVCNADEGDPGAYMDRSVLESDPHRVIEGMTIAAYAVGATEGYIYVRAEYPLAVQRLKTAIRQAERYGFLGSQICETPFAFTLQIRLGAGAFVCGEETALLASIEGRRGIPQPRPPYPAEHGLFGYPTLINNVETFANVPEIARHGGDLFAQTGLGRSRGTKVFALAGRIKNGGLIEVPMGITLREVIFDVGGGLQPDEAHGSVMPTFKAAQTGGPSGGFIPEQFLDMSVDYESLAQAGSIMGSGGLIVMDSTSCVVDVAKYFMDFCRTESCGTCIPCRVGTMQMHELLDKISRFEATEDDLVKLEELSDLVQNTSLCGLGQGAPNPVLSTLKYFREEYLAHVLEHRCPAGVCGHNLEAEPAAKGKDTLEVLA
ncbi:MAG TPA: NuoF family protein [Deinococcales bacterium]|nr:NuoF family protein [Deinococcales bacterium]